MPEEKAKHSQIEGLATLLVLNDEIRKLSSIREFGFYSTNETHHLIPYHTAYLWQPKLLTGVEIVAQSGIAEIDEHAPANQWLSNTIKKILSQPDATSIHQIMTHPTRADILGGDLDLFALSAHEEFADNLLWCPFVNKSNEILGGLVLFRETPYSDDEIKMLRWLIASYQYTWQTLQKQKKTAFLKRVKERPYLLTGAIILTIILLFPVRLTVFGVGTVAPMSPVLINAPMQGVIKSFAVSPGEHVKAGQLLLTLDKADLLADVEVSKRDYLLTQAKLRSAINEGFDNSASRSDIPLLRAQLAIDQAHLDYTNSLLAKSDLVSPAEGIVIFDSKEDWIGQPVQTGERILVVANPDSVEVKITVPVTNYIKMNVGDDGKFYLYGSLSSTPITIKTLGYNAEVMPNKVLGFQLIADFVDKSYKPQLGSQGNVEIYGNRVPFFYYLLRRPIHATRRLLGI
jgi:hypothetical protein